MGEFVIEGTVNPTWNLRDRSWAREESGLSKLGLIGAQEAWRSCHIAIKGQLAGKNNILYNVLEGCDAMISMVYKGFIEGPSKAKEDANHCANVSDAVYGPRMTPPYELRVWLSRMTPRMTRVYPPKGFF